MNMDGTWTVKPYAPIQVTGTATRVGVETEGENGGAVLVIYVERDTNGNPLPPGQIARTWLGLPKDMVGYLTDRIAYGRRQQVAAREAAPGATDGW
jgi:hypothetical protein